MLGCFRKGEANDPGTFVTAVTATLARYPDAVIIAVTDPTSGLPAKQDFLPTVREVRDACEEAWYPIRVARDREKRVQEQLQTRQREDRGERPTIEQLRSKYGENWGIEPARPVKTADEKAKENVAAREREEARVRAEYEHLGQVAPSKLALSPTALRIIAQQEELRNAS